MIYTDDTPMPVGRYKFTALCRVPAEYLIQIYVNKEYKNRDPDLHHYLEDNMEKIIQRKEGLIPEKPFRFPCDKITYLTANDARRVLVQIQGQEQNHKKPVREYECPKCGGWHLTSVSLDEWQKSKTNVLSE